MAKWARSAYELPVGVVSILPLKNYKDGPVVAQTHSEKAEILGARFFPALLANLDDLPQQDIEYDGHQRFEVNQRVTPKDIGTLVYSLLP